MNPNGIAMCMECEAKSIGQYFFSLILGIEKKIQAEKILEDDFLKSYTHMLSYKCKQWWSCTLKIRFLS